LVLDQSLASLHMLQGLRPDFWS